MLDRQALRDAAERAIAASESDEVNAYVVWYNYLNELDPFDVLEALNV